MKNTIYQQLTDAINNIKDARNPYDAGTISKHQAIQAIGNAISNLNLAVQELQNIKEDN